MLSKHQCVKGMRPRDFHQTQRMTDMIDTLKAEFRNRGAEERDYPTIEQTERLMEKYGDDEKLIYNLVGNDDTPLSLRYDLTTQYVLYMGDRTKRLPTFQIGKVFRRDTPSASNVRFREFYQADYDMLGYDGESERIFALLETFDCLLTALDKLGVENVEIQINDRRAVDAVMERVGVPPEKRATVCSSLDKLDKHDRAYISSELVNVKNIPVPVVDALFVELDKNIQPTEDVQMILDTSDRIRFVPFLMRGLSYYTGVVFEVRGKELDTISIGGGGESATSIGFSIGLDRILDLVKNRFQPTRPLYLITFGGPKVFIAAQKKAAEMRKTQPVKIYPIPKPAKLKNAIAKANQDSGRFEVFGPDNL